MSASAPNWHCVGQDLGRALRGAVRVDEPMSRHTTIGVGGRARVLVTPRSIAQVARIVRYAMKRGIEYVVVGKGSNLIVRDGGFDGVVLKMSVHLSRVRVNQRSVRAEGGASFARLARTMTRAGRTGLEFGIGIPGTVGGAVRMNAGAFGGEVRDVLQRVRLVRADGTLETIRAGDVDFAYRRSGLPKGAVVVAATFRCAPGPIRRDVYNKSLARKETQPLSERSFGSTFVNPPGKFAAALIEGCGLKGRCRGGAMISKKHANFIVNVDGSATANDVEGLIRLARNEVRRRYGVMLRTEVIVIGNR